MYARNKKKKKKKNKKIRNQSRIFPVRVRVLFATDPRRFQMREGASLQYAEGKARTYPPARVCAYAGAAARFVRFAGLSYFDTYKLQPKRFDALKRDFSRKIWKCGFLFVSLQPETIKL